MFSAVGCRSTCSGSRVLYFTGILYGVLARVVVGVVVDGVLERDVQGVFFLIWWICFLNNCCPIASFAAKFRALRLEGLPFCLYALRLLWVVSVINYEDSNFEIWKIWKIWWKVWKFKIVRIISEKFETILNWPFWEILFNHFARFLLPGPYVAWALFNYRTLNVAYIHFWPEKQKTDNVV